MQALYISIIVTSMLALVASTEFKNCTKGPAPMEVRIKNCDSLPCKVHVSGKLSGEMYFVAPYYVSVLYTTVMAHTSGDTQTMPSPQEDNACRQSLNKCPTAEGDRLTYSFSIKITDDYKKFIDHESSLDIALLDAKNDVYVCANIPLVVAKS